MFYPYLPLTEEIDVLGSRFLASLYPLEEKEDVKRYLLETKEKFPKATHYPYAFRILPFEGMGDDGEPKGSTGLPLLEALRLKEADKVLVVVTRYFGGVLLGTGGLLRAYTKSAKDALDAAGICVVRRWVKAEIACSYAMLERLKTECTAIGGVVADIEYSADVCLKLLLPEDKADAFAQRTADVTAGASELEITGEEFKPVRIR